jgi:hypothetical protein
LLLDDGDGFNLLTHKIVTTTAVFWVNAVDTELVLVVVPLLDQHFSRNLSL